MRKEASIPPALQASKKSHTLQAQIGEDYDGKAPLKAESLILHCVPYNFKYKQINEQRKGCKFKSLNTEIYIYS